MPTDNDGFQPDDDGFIPDKKSDPLVTGEGMMGHAQEQAKAALPQPQYSKDIIGNLNASKSFAAPSELTGLPGTPQDDVSDTEHTEEWLGPVATAGNVLTNPRTIPALVQAGIGSAGGGYVGRHVGKMIGGDTGADYGDRIGTLTGGLAGGIRGYGDVPEPESPTYGPSAPQLGSNINPPPPPEIGSPENPGFHAKLPTRMPTQTETPPELGHPDNPGIQSKIPTGRNSMPKAPAGLKGNGLAFQAEPPIRQAVIPQGGPSPLQSFADRLPAPQGEGEASIGKRISGVSVYPEPNAPGPGINPGNMQSVPREELPGLAKRGTPGAALQEQNLGKKIIYRPKPVIGTK